MSTFSQKKHTDAYYKLQANLCKLFTHPIRVKIIDLLKDKEMSVTEIAEALQLNLSTVSQHLALFRTQHIVETRRSGNVVYYRIRYPEVNDFIQALCRVLQRIFEDQQGIENLFANTEE